MKTMFLICCLLACIGAGSVSGAVPVSDTNQTNQTDLTNLTSEDMVDLPNGTSINVLVIMPVTIIMNSPGDMPPRHGWDKGNFTGNFTDMMGKGPMMAPAFDNESSQADFKENMAAIRNGTEPARHINSTPESSVSRNQTPMGKPNLTITW